MIPELRADIAAGTAGNIELALVGIVAIRTFPNEFSVFIFFDFYFAVIAADLTIVAFRIKLGVHYMVIYKFHNR